ncbi:DUF6638 family protein [Algimonas porphyrae]|uniref:Uncharacterized protein n=1 Tax=Algimonas porphyrae TaxID=1128113 RepID=A0ABQ5V237_9PROT|nr:DUF6638 family protein [Algimonas porphyrae]GLQ21619.1 hypothetical protein GCM10007854_25740 [Algimonas porphyrae]
MMRLIKAGLMYGNLYEVSSKAMVERYNRALEFLIGKRTGLTEFHIDIAGYSPEVAHELDDELYLNPLGANQMFILLSLDQKTAPLLGSQFSTSRSILRRYIDDNEAQLFALTAREAVAGELLDSVFKIDSPSDLLDLNRIEVSADTTQSHVAEAEALTGQIDRFLRERDAWWDDVLIAEMIELAKRTGNIQRNPVKLDSQVFTQGNYFTTHFGGVYIFRDAQTPTLISRNPVAGIEDVDIAQTLTLNDRKAISDWLYEEGLTELIVQRPNSDNALIIRQKLDFIVASTAADQGHDLSDLTRQNVRQLERRYANELPDEYVGLMEVWRWASMGGRVPKLGPDHPAFFYALRASRHPDRDLVNMLLSELSGLDFRQLFICHKSLFYEAYRDWSDSKKDFVVRFLEHEYAIDKAGAREALFGPEPAMDEPAAPRTRGRKNPESRNPWAQPEDKRSRDRDDDDDDDADEDDDDWRHRSRQRRAYDRRQRDKDRSKKKKRKR